ncbi:NIF3-like protein 1 isoform X3 [Engystomops pustulosus]
MLCARPLWLLAASPRWSPLRLVMDLSSVVSRLDALAPPALAESWDNVGLLVEPTPPHQVRRILLTNDVTEEVLEEALGGGAHLLLSYHPPIFKPLKRLTCGPWKERLMVRALEGRLAVYSPHTACDALANGVNAWLGRALGPCVSVPLRPSTALSHPGGYSHVLEVRGDLPEAMLSRVSALQGACVRTYPLRGQDQGGARVRLSCSQKALLQALAILKEDPEVYKGVELLALQKPPLLDTHHTAPLWGISPVSPHTAPLWGISPVSPHTAPLWGISPVSPHTAPLWDISPVSLAPSAGHTSYCPPLGYLPCLSSYCPPLGHLPCLSSYCPPLGHLPCLSSPLCWTHITLSPTGVSPLSLIILPPFGTSPLSLLILPPFGASPLSL